MDVGARADARKAREELRLEHMLELTNHAWSQECMQKEALLKRKIGEISALDDALASAKRQTMEATKKASGLGDALAAANRQIVEAINKTAEAAEGRRQAEARCAVNTAEFAKYLRAVNAIPPPSLE